ncbi:EG45-like domain containing protein isoform X2 [Euphorbia lathyris]|uniref:EG45-like domain containing protein isoform X2 n=1 Tax=Euphorbia lathyris TaxID=212925 RepID=UPI003313A6B2
MSPQPIGISPFLFIFFFFFIISSATIFQSSLADIGPAARYTPPYIPTACFDNEVSQFPTDNMFAAAGEGIWDNGASCGRSYLVRCISASSTTICDPSKIIQVKIVDRAQTSISIPSADGAIIVLSDTAFSQFTNSPASLINVEFRH